MSEPLPHDTPARPDGGHSRHADSAPSAAQQHVARTRSADPCAQIAARFGEFAQTYPQLRLYRAICDGAAADAQVCRLLLNAPNPGQRRPVLLLAALHDLVLRLGPAGSAAAPWYPSVAGAAATRALNQAAAQHDSVGPWPDVRATMLDHAEQITTTIATQTMQTNEVNRAGYVLPLLALASAELPHSPVALVELGASAGLLLTSDHYNVRIHDGEPGSDHDAAPGLDELGWGDPGSTVAVSTSDLTESVHLPLSRRGLTLPPILARIGVDRAPVDLTDPEAVRWLTACLWPEVPGRVERFGAAVAQHLAGTSAASALPAPPVVAGDATQAATVIAAAEAALTQASGPAATGSYRGDPHLIVLTSWATTYMKRADRAGIADALARLARAGTPVTWVSAEAQGAVPGLPQRPSTPPVDPRQVGTTVLAARRWRDGREVAPIVWGVADAHAAWIRLAPPVKT